MDKTKLSAALILAQTIVACSPAPKPCASSSSLKNAYNNIQCDISYSKLDTSKLGGVKIEDYGVPNAEKIRHLNEINSMPKEYIAILRAQTTIMLSAGGITNIPAYANLKGVTPRGWPAGSTWDSVPGVGSVQSLGLGDSNLATGTNSLAMHESGHSVTIGIGMLEKKELKNAFAKDKALPNGSDDAYRMNYIEEYVAMAIDDYYCNSKTRAQLQRQRPNAYAFMENDFIRLLQESGVGKEDPNAPKDEPTPTPDPTPTPTPTPTPDPEPTPTDTVPDDKDTGNEPSDTGSTDKPKGSDDATPEVDPVLKPRKAYNMCQ